MHPSFASLHLTQHPGLKNVNLYGNSWPYLTETDASDFLFQLDNVNNAGCRYIIYVNFSTNSYNIKVAIWRPQ
jgi:hypothetical protein